MSTAFKDYLSSIICKNSVNNVAISFKTEIHTFAGEYADRGVPRF